MQSFVYSYPTKVYFGQGAARQALEAELSALSAQGADSAGCSYADGAITVWA